MTEAQFGEAWERLVGSQPGDVWELDSAGEPSEPRLVYPAGSPEAAAFHAKYGDPDHPVDLEPATPEPTKEPVP